MIVSFETRDLQEACLTLRIAEERFGALHAQALIALIAEIEAFKDADQLIAFIGDYAVIGDDDSLSLPIGANSRARFVAAGTRFERDVKSRVVWSSVTRFKLMEVEGY